MANSIAKLRLTAFKHQNGRCYYCGLPMWLKSNARQQGPTRLQCTAEHLVARQDGGGDTADNIVAACRFCNATRHKISSPPEPAEYKDHVTKRMKAGKWHPRIASQTGAVPLKGRDGQP